MLASSVVVHVQVVPEKDTAGFADVVSVVNCGGFAECVQCGVVTGEECFGVPGVFRTVLAAVPFVPFDLYNTQLIAT